jgi:7-cyano-7-deazaguanine reductase
MTLIEQTDTDTLGAAYRALDRALPMRGVDAIDANCLLTFPYPIDGAPQEIAIDTDEFTAVCPWTGLPDYGTLVVRYVPYVQCLELKSLKYYLLSYRDVGIVQEHATDRLLRDLAAACQPQRMTITLDYKVRGGLHTVTSASYARNEATTMGD